MTHQRRVTEEDFRMPEFRNAKAEDYEFRHDGKLVRKDRWEKTVQSIRYLVGIDAKEFELDDVLERVRVLVKQQEWTPYLDEPPPGNAFLDVELDNGSVLMGVQAHPTEKDVFVWNCGVSEHEDDERLLHKNNIVGWRVRQR